MYMSIALTLPITTALRPKKSPKDSRKSYAADARMRSSARILSVHTQVS